MAYWAACNWCDWLEEVDAVDYESGDGKKKAIEHAMKAHPHQWARSNCPYCGTQGCDTCIKDLRYMSEPAREAYIEALNRFETYKDGDGLLTGEELKRRIRERKAFGNGAGVKR